MKKMRKCPECGAYTMAERHCAATVSVYPPKYSPADKYGEYRRKAKENDL
jgi:H/ACA ribonucleoprotein complex subunit 3